MQDWKDPSEFYGCGKFVSDSWRIFCRGETSSKGVEDATLQRYLRWLNTGSLSEPKPRQPRASKGEIGIVDELFKSFFVNLINSAILGWQVNC